MSGLAWSGHGAITRCVTLVAELVSRLAKSRDKGLTRFFLILIGMERRCFFKVSYIIFGYVQLDQRAVEKVRGLNSIYHNIVFKHGG